MTAPAARFKTLHIPYYTNNGSYTVSLTVNDGSTSKTETKNNMIIVGPDGINEVYDNPVKMYPNPVIDQLNLNAESVILNISSL